MSGPSGNARAPPRAASSFRPLHALKGERRGYRRSRDAPTAARRPDGGGVGRREHGRPRHTRHRGKRAGSDSRCTHLPLTAPSQRCAPRPQARAPRCQSPRTARIPAVLVGERTAALHTLGFTKTRMRRPALPASFARYAPSIAAAGAETAAEAPSHSREARGRSAGGKTRSSTSACFKRVCALAAQRAPAASVVLTSGAPSANFSGF